jgi:hypothetical protein
MPSDLVSSVSGVGSVIERGMSVRGRAVPDTRDMGRGGTQGEAQLQPARRTAEDYQTSWRAFYETAIESRRGENTARAIANEHLMRLRAEDEGRELRGLGDIEAYF